jgi:hypothetical protein
MRKTIEICALALLASTLAVGCGHSEKTTIRRETVQTIPPPAVVEKRTTTVETAPAPPIVEHRSTTVRSGSVERTIDE